MSKKRGGRTKSALDQSMIRLFLVAPLLDALAKSSVPVADFLGRHGLSSVRTDHLYERVPLAQFVALIEGAAVQLQRPFLGLELGSQFGVTDLGPFCGSFIRAKNLGAALGQLARFQSSLQSNTLLEIVRGSETSICRYRIQDSAIWPRLQDAEFALAAFTTFIRELIGVRWRPVAVEFEHDVAGREQALRLFFNAPVTGGRDYNALVLTNADIDRPLHWRWDLAKPDVALIVERHMQELLGVDEETSMPVVDRARALITRRLGRTKVTIELIAAEMSMSERSLRRHLALAGTSFRDLLQSHRRKAVEAILASHGERLSTVADRLNYSDSAVLSRAFKGWTGVSPRTYARTRKRSSPS